MEKIFVISDTHFWHRNIIKYENRPWNHNDVMIENWNSVVGEGDTVYHLGDFALCSFERKKQVLEQLNGKIILFRGNHDKGEAQSLALGFQKFLKIPPILYVNDIEVILSHYRLTEDQYRTRKNDRINIHGHHHSNTPLFSTGYINVSVENINYTPVELNYIVNLYLEWEARNREEVKRVK